MGLAGEESTFAFAVPVPVLLENTTLLSASKFSWNGLTMEGFIFFKVAICYCSFTFSRALSFVCSGRCSLGYFQNEHLLLYLCPSRELFPLKAWTFRPAWKLTTID
jgi:hypothetical protein